MNKEIKIGNRIISEKTPAFIIAEMSGNHNMDYDRALEIINAAKDAGVDAIKLQTYMPDTITMDSDQEYFKTLQGLWEGTTLYKLYETAYTPWDWQPKLMKAAEALGLICFSSPFDLSSVDFLEKMDVPAYKIASFEINDIPLIRKIAKLGKPIIISTGIAFMEDIERALSVCKEEGNEDVILLKCTSAYPSPYEDMNIKLITNMQETFGCICGLSDHSMGSTVAVAGVALGAKVIEKHLTLKRADGGSDSGFSMEADEFKQMVDEIRIAEKALGRITYELTEVQKESRKHSRSLFVVEDVKQGEIFTEKNIRSIRPGCGLHTMHYEEVLGKYAACDISRGTPMEWALLKI